MSLSLTSGVPSGTPRLAATLGLPLNLEMTWARPGGSLWAETRSLDPSVWLWPSSVAWRCRSGGGAGPLPLLQSVPPPAPVPSLAGAPSPPTPALLPTYLSQGQAQRWRGDQPDWVATPTSLPQYFSASAAKLVPPISLGPRVLFGVVTSLFLMQGMQEGCVPLSKCNNALLFHHHPPSPQRALLCRSVPPHLKH